MSRLEGVLHYRTLDPAHITDTAGKLSLRVAERFPGTGLSRVAAEFVVLSRDIAAEAETLRGPIWWVRGVVALVIFAGAAIFLFVGTIVSFGRISTDVTVEFMQGLEASINTVILAFVGLVALITTEERIKRKRVFRALHGLRSLIHVIDMHQLTKDPAALSPAFKPTAQSPRRITDPAELSRYLDYCSEMLAISGKLAALFAQAVDDAVVVDAVNDIETLGSNLSRKIWQKITLIEGASRTVNG